MAFKLVVSDPKTRKSYQKEVSEGLVGKKIGDKVDGKIAGLDGFELQITGGSDNDGFPMRKDVSGTARKKILVSHGTGFHARQPGMRKRMSIRGNTISEDISQINTKVLLIEVFSNLCPHCHKEAPQVNELYEAIEGRADLKGKVFVREKGKRHVMHLLEFAVFGTIICCPNPNQLDFSL